MKQSGWVAYWTDGGDMPEFVGVFDAETSAKDACQEAQRSDEGQTTEPDGSARIIPEDERWTLEWEELGNAPVWEAEVDNGQGVYRVQWVE